MLNHHPCRMVQIVGWVASVEDKLDKMFITCKSSLWPLFHPIP